jgi:hypothetical protein
MSHGKYHYNVLDLWIIGLHSSITRGHFLNDPVGGVWTPDIYKAYGWHYKRDLIESIRSERGYAGGLSFARRRCFLSNDKDRITLVLPKGMSKCQVCGNELDGHISCDNCGQRHLYT